MYRTVYWNNVTSFEATCYLPLLFAERARCAAIAGYFSKLDVPRSLQSGGHLSNLPCGASRCGKPVGTVATGGFK